MTNREEYKSCGPWMRGDYTPLKGRVRNAICTKHGGHSRTASVYLRHERCNIARRMLPKAR